MLTGPLPQRRSLATPDEEIPEPPGPKDDDVTKSESNSDGSQKSTERSQEAAPSTLMAEDQRAPREHPSAADADPDMEDASKTLVLFSPGDTRKSPSGGEHGLEGELATPTALSYRTDRLLVGELVQPEPSETGRLSPALRSDLRPSTPVAPASPPFTKVERTFIHIAETSHLNVMSSNGHSAKDSDRDVLGIVKDLPVEDNTSEPEGTPVKEDLPEVPDQTPSVDKQLKTESGLSTVLPESLDPVLKAMSPVHENKDLIQERRDDGAKPLTPVRERPTVTKARIRSRIPVLISEEESGSEQSASLSARTRLHQRAKQLDLTRLLVQKQQGLWIRRRMLSGTSSSLSSGDDERPRVSETLSTTGSEEDTHTSDESKRSVRYRTAEGQGSKESRSRIPRPVAPVNRSLGGLAALSPSPLSLPDSSSTKGAPPYANGYCDDFPFLENKTVSGCCKVLFQRNPTCLILSFLFYRNQKIGLSTFSTQCKSKPPLPRSSSSCPRPSASCPRPSAAPATSGSPRMPLRALFGTRRSLSSAHCRTDSPSPQRAGPSRQPLSVRAPTVPMLPPRTTTTMRRSASQDPAAQSSSGTASGKSRPKAAGPTRGKANAREKSVTAR